MTTSPTYKVGERRRSKARIVWTIIAEMPHANGDPAHLRVRSEPGRRERTIYAVDWSQMSPA